MLIDTHTHLDMPEFDSDRDEVIARARSAGLAAMITVGINLDSARSALDLVEQYDFIYCALGVHPHEAKHWNPMVGGELSGLLDHPRAVAVGETGLDFFRDHSPRRDQRRAFHEQIAIARDKSLPVVVHDRDAHKEVLDILKEEGADAVGGVIHCFSGDVAMAERCLDMGFYISIPGIITFPKAEEIRRVVRATPLDRLLVETDAPYLAPVPFRGKRNEPAYVAYTAAELARIKEIPLEEAGRATARNAKALFRIP
jgi:TatD DNase family protein